MAGQPQWQQVGGNAAEVYERHLVPAMFAPWAPGIVAAAHVRPAERVLDVACGTGVVTRLAAARVGGAGRVVGLDLNAAMLAVARALPPVPGARIAWCAASRACSSFRIAPRRWARCGGSCAPPAGWPRASGAGSRAARAWPPWWPRWSGTSASRRPTTGARRARSATPLATLGGLTERARAAVSRDVRAALRAYVDADGLAFPMEAHLVVAHN